MFLIAMTWSCLLPAQNAWAGDSKTFDKRVQAIIEEYDSIIIGKVQSVMENGGWALKREDNKTVGAFPVFPGQMFDDSQLAQLRKSAAATSRKRAG